MKIIFSHGLESGPWGIKIQRMAEIAKTLGFAVDSIDYTDTRIPIERVARLLSVICSETDKVVLVGSSMGGYVSLAAAESRMPTAMFLLAPAINLPGYPTQIHTCPACETVIVHGWNDDVVPVANSIQYAQRCRATLHLLDGDHRLIDVLDEVEVLFESFLRRQIAG